MQSNWLPEIIHRAQIGPFMKESDYELALAMKIKERVKHYGILFDPKRPVPKDDDMADRIFQAGVDVFVEMGVYCQTTERRILFSRDEVREALAFVPAAVTLGTGKDAVVMRHRKVEDTIPCVVHSGPTGTPCSERYHPLILLSCAQEPLVNCLGAGSVSTFNGNPIIPGSATEILGSRRDARVARDAVAKAGRPGMHINDVAVSLTCAGKIAACDTATGLRPSDGLLVSQMVELKTDFDQLSRVAFMQEYGIHIVDLMTPLIGGIGGGAEGTAVVTVANHLLGVLCYRASYHMFSHTHMRWVNNTDRMGLWMQTMLGGALARNTQIVTLNDIYTVSGPGTKELLYECAAGAAAGTAGGFNIQGAGCTGGYKRDHTTGLEARFIAEVSNATLGWNRDQVNALCLAMLEKYERTFNDPQRGHPFWEVYNEETIEPKTQWLDIYYSVKDELTVLGLKFQFSSQPKKVTAEEIPAN
jgi:methylamine---corrinoid protein Co-methyltransferase